MSEFVNVNDWSKGGDNLAGKARLPAGFVRHLVNVDAQPAGNLTLRAGYERVYAGTNVRGSLALGDKVLIADGTDLVEMDTHTLATRVLRTIAGAGVFAGGVLNNTLYFCTANECLEYDGSRVRMWGVPDVTNQPVVTTSDGGSILEGYYRVAVTYVDMYGREGGTDLPSVIHVGAGGLLSVDVTTIPAGCKARLYVGANSGDTLYMQAEALTPTVLDVTSLRDDTLRCGTVLNRAPTPGTYVISHNGMLAISHGKVVQLTRPLRPHLIDRVRGFVQYSTDVGMLLSTGEALYVSADKTYALTGVETDGISQRVVLEFPAIAGTAVSMSDTRGAWMTEQGQAIADGGAVKMVNRDHYAPVVSASGTAGVLDNNGNQLIVTALKGANRANPMAVSDFYIGEILNP